MLPDRIFVTGTGTDVGKSVISAVLLAGMRGHYWKPIQSGTLDATDTMLIQGLTGLDQDHFLPETYRLNQPLSPHTSAELDGVKISLDDLSLPDAQSYRTLIVEGAGGIMVPLNDRETMLDLIEKLSLPTVVVADSGLGTINHTLLTVDKLKRHHIDVLGVVMNGIRNPPNRRAIERFGQVDVLAEVEPMEDMGPQVLEECFQKHFSS
ncbi:MAG: dethiobiotin synthase [Gammaproteobacteria bacterium]|jgi:dethiobiotin synthetase|nr:dethiobiotin synthase [Gammaproteobacteria bacterium]MBT4494121.1 dethiobiotin synthase [Gammaproteobacteria bacterium]MBT7371073.1 dethiobiotin synthase [Gammaproteobacteria bacterium]